MARQYNDALREEVARTLMAREGFQFAGESLLAEAQRGNPRAVVWVGDADAALAVIFPRLAKRPS